MNPDEVENLARVLKRASADLAGILAEVNGLVRTTSWVGIDADRFKGPWWHARRARLQAVASDLDGFGQSALNNAGEQREASMRTFT